MRLPSASERSRSIIDAVASIWMTEHTTGETKFVTLYPDKK